MRIIQISDNLQPGNAVTMDGLNIQNVLRDSGCETQLYANKADNGLPRNSFLPLEKMGTLGESDIVIFHPTRASADLIRWVGELPCRKIIRHNNLTPPSFLEAYSEAARPDTEAKNAAMRDTHEKYEFILAPSNEDLEEMRRLGYTKQPYGIAAPCVIDPDEYLLRTPPSPGVVQRYADGRTNIVYVSRIVPNKKQEDAVAAFAYYKRHFDPTARMIFPGRVIFPAYHEDLRAYCKRLGLSGDDVVFPGAVPFADILAYYRIADLFLFTSEHEGFGIPPLEAMLFGIPVIAFRFAAVPETMAGGGVLLDEKDPVLTACWMDRLMRDRELREKIVSDYPRVLRKYDRKAFTTALLGSLGGYIKSILPELPQADYVDAMRILSYFDMETGGLIWG